MLQLAGQCFTKAWLLRQVFTGKLNRRARFLFTTWVLVSFFCPCGRAGGCAGHRLGKGPVPPVLAAWLSPDSINKWGRGPEGSSVHLAVFVDPLFGLSGYSQNLLFKCSFWSAALQGSEAILAVQWSHSPSRQILCTLFPWLADYSPGMIPIYLSAQTEAVHLHPIIQQPEPPESWQKMTPAWPGSWLATALHTAPQPAPTALIWSTQGKHTLHLKNCHESLVWGKGPPGHHWPVHPAGFWAVRVPPERGLAEIMLESFPKAQSCLAGVQDMLPKTLI